MDPLADPEDAKLVTLARTARLRGYPVPADGAAARDETGRTYAAATVALGERSISALAGALSAAVSSGARSFEAFALVAAEPALGDDDRGLLAALAPGVPVLLAGPDGTVLSTVVLPAKV